MQITQNPWGAEELDFSAEALASMGQKLISEDDIREKAYCAQSASGYFEGAGELRTACLRRGILTFWADYREGK